MSEELLQRDLINNPEKIGKWDFRNIGSTTLGALKNAGIIPKKDYKDFERRKPDGIITSKKEVIAIIENKDISKFKTAKQKEEALQQGLDVAQVLNAKIVIVTDTIDTIWVNAFNGEEILDEKGRPLLTNFNPKNQDLEKLIEQIIDSIDKNNSQLREPRLKDPTRLAKSVWQDLWMAAGATPENCLYSFVELFIFKYLSDLGILKGHLSYDFIMDMFEKQTEQVVLEYYADQVRKHIKQNLFPVTTPDNTTIINGTIFVSKDEKAVEGYGSVFHKILKKFGDEKEGGGELRNIDKDFKSKLFETFLKESISKKNWGQYFTPLKVVRAMVKMAESEIKEGITICDPACGVGKFLLEPLLINNNVEHFYEVKNNKLINKITLVGIDKGFDKEEQKTIILAKANMLIYMSDMIRKYPDLTPEFSTLFNDTFELKTKNILGTLRDTTYEGKIDLILTNPPYVTTGSSNLKEEIIKCNLQSHYKINAMGVEGLFMEWIIRALKPGGKAFVVLPNGLFDRQTDKRIRDYLLEECIIDAVFSLPEKTFFTTQQKTYIIGITKKINKSGKQTDPVFTYLVSEIGETLDNFRFDTEQDDLYEAVNLFSFFKGNKKGFETINTSKRCKIQPTEMFYKNTRWLFDKWWTEEEKIELGIAENENSVSFNELPMITENVANSILLLKDEMNDFALQDTSLVENNLSYKKEKISKLFYLEKGKAIYTNQYIVTNPGNFPLYSSQTTNDGIIGNINNFDYDGIAITWTTDGIYAGTVFLRKGKFSMTTHCGALILKQGFENVCLEYIFFYLKNNLRNFAVGTQNKRVTTEIIKNIEIPIPVDLNGNFDLNAQQKIAEKYQFVERMQNELKEQVNKLIYTNIKL
ncbi:N-6 DNA methylase [Candidatus Symbiothrix dinenymphae]|nr:N-6 DNA methylase [Candidatus Symbiothrix dinenymphae]